MKNYRKSFQRIQDERRDLLGEPGDFNPRRPQEKDEDNLWCNFCNSYYSKEEAMKEKWIGWQTRCKFCLPDSKSLRRNGCVGRPPVS